MQEKEIKDPEYLAMKVIEFNLQGLGLTPEDTKATIIKVKEIVKK